MSVYQGDEMSCVVETTLGGQLSRRTVLHRAVGFAIAAPALGTLLAACGGDSDEDDEPIAAATADTAEETVATTTEDNDEDESDSTATADSEEEPAAAEAGEEIIYRALGEFANLDQHHSGGNQDTIAILNVHSRLVYFERPDDESEPELLPDLATAWEMAEDATEVSFTLRENVTWHKDYGEFTAADVAYTLDRIRDPEVASRWRADWSHVNEVIVEDDYRVKVVLEIPDPLILQTGFSRTGTILNQRAVEELGDEYSSNPIGTGPFIFDSWSRGEQAVLVRNEGHWLFETGESNIQRAIFRFVEDDQAALLAFEAGELDMGFFELPEIQLAAVDNPELNVDRRPHTRINRISFGTRPQEHIIHDVHFRRALSLAMDRELIAEEAFEGMATPPIRC